MEIRKSCPDLKITVHIFYWYLLLTWPWNYGWKKFAHKIYQIWCQWKENFILVNFCHGTYSWFLSVFGLLTFKECITWPRCKRWICFSSRKTYRIMYHWKENFMLTNICSRIYSWILSILGLLSFKEWVTWPWCKGWICFSCKIFRIWYHWKENFMLINNCSRTPSRF